MTSLLFSGKIKNVGRKQWNEHPAPKFFLKRNRLPKYEFQFYFLDAILQQPF